jgi:hypothetical protein
MKQSNDGGGRKMTPARAARVAAAYKQAQINRPFSTNVHPVMSRPRTSADVFAAGLARRNPRWPK